MDGEPTREQDRADDQALPGHEGPARTGSPTSATGELAARASRLQKKIFSAIDTYDTDGTLTEEALQSVPKQAWKDQALNLLELHASAPQGSLSETAEFAGWDQATIGDWFDEAGTAAYLTDYCNDLQESWKSIVILKAAAQLERKIKMGAHEAVQWFDGQIAEALTVSGRKASTLAEEFYDLRLEAHEVKQGTKIPDPGFTTGFEKLDHYCRFRRGELIVVAGRTSTGKSALMSQFMRHHAEQHGGVLCYSMEMSNRALAERHASSIMGLNYGFMVMDPELMKQKADDLNQYLEAYQGPASRIYSEFERRATVHAVCRAARMYHRKRGISMLVLDYLQRLRPTEMTIRQDRRFQVEEMTGALKDLAEELDIPVLVLSQLSRQAEARTGNAKIVDLAEASSIEADADLILLINRAIGGQGAELDLAKQRVGRAGMVFSADFRGSTTEFSITGVKDE